MRRSQIEIIYSILCNLQDKPLNKCKMLTKANLNYSVLIEYTEKLIDVDIINYDKKTYTLTDKGRQIFFTLKSLIQKVGVIA